MPPQHHRRLTLFLLLALLVPGLVLVALSVRMMRQERELAEKRRHEEQERLVLQVRQELLNRLERIKLEALSALAAGRDYQHPAGVLVARVEDDRVIPPWEAGQPREEFRRAVSEAGFAREVREGERAELKDRRFPEAAARYREALRLARNPAQRGYAKLLLARVLAKSDNHSEAATHQRELLSSSVIDDQGVPLKLYAASQLVKERGSEQAVLTSLRSQLEQAGRVAPAAYYLMRDLAQNAPELREAVEEHIREVELYQTLQTEFPRIASLQRPRGGEPVWVPCGGEACLASVAESLAGLPPALVAVRTERITESLGPVRLVAGSADGRPLGESFPGLKVAFAAAPPPGEWTPAHSFYLAALVLVLSVTFVGGFLLWRDVRRELHLADLRAQFVSSVSHELRTPLTAIRMFAETLRMGRWKDAHTQEEYLDTIVSESERLARLVDNVLNFSRIERGKKVYLLKSVSLPAVVRAAVRTVQYPLAQQGFRLKAEVEDGLPPVKGDADALEQAILNLLTNAMKYSGDSREIEIALRRADGRAEIRVVDHGIGIPPEEQRRIFEKFYRAPTRENQLIPGAGLGLTLVEHVVKAHGGQITVESAPGQGSAFSVRLPLEGGA